MGSLGGGTGLIPVPKVRVNEDEVVYPVSGDILDYQTPIGASASGNFELEKDLEDDFSSYTDDANAELTYPTTETARTKVRTASNDLWGQASGLINAKCAVDLETLLGRALDANKWVLRLAVTEALTGADDRLCETSLGLSSTPHTSTFDVAQDFVSIYLSRSTAEVNAIRFMVGNGVALNSGNVDSFTDTDGGVKYYEIKRNGDTFDVTEFSDAEFTNPVETGQIVLAGIAGLRYLYLAVKSSGASGINKAVVMTCTKWEFWDGVDSVNSETSSLFDTNLIAPHITNEQVNPYQQIEMSAVADKRPVSVAIYPDKANMTETTLLIQTSKDGIILNDKKQVEVSDLDNLAWNFIQINVDSEDMRFIRIVGNGGESSKLSHTEIKFRHLSGDIIAQRHGHNRLI